MMHEPKRLAAWERTDVVDVLFYLSLWTLDMLQLLGQHV